MRGEFQVSCVVVKSVLRWFKSEIVQVQVVVQVVVQSQSGRK